MDILVVNVVGSSLNCSSSVDILVRKAFMQPAAPVLGSNATSEFFCALTKSK